MRISPSKILPSNSNIPFSLIFLFLYFYSVEMKKILVLLLGVLICGFAFTKSYAQRPTKEEPLLNYTITGIKGNIIDTLGYETGQRIIKETEGLIEKEIDPNEYILGPQDILLVSIVASQPKELEAEVSPEGKIAIPGVGVIDVKNKTLAEAQTLIVEKVRSIIKATEVNVLLKSIRKFKVSISGAVQKSAVVAASSTDRVSEVIDRAGGFKNKASIRQILLYRNYGKDVFEVDLLRYFFLSDKNSNPTVQGGDHIVVPFTSDDEFVQAVGEVNNPGKFEFRANDSLSTLLRFAQGFTEISFLDSVEFVRMVGPNEFVTSYLDLRSWKDAINNPTSKLPNDFPLKMGDRVFIRQIPDWKRPMSVIIEGEVVYPGRYPVDEKNFRLSDLLLKCGGFKNTADVEKTRLFRKSLEDIVDPEMERLARIPPSEMSKNEYRYFLSRINERKGLMSIDFYNVTKNPESDDNIVLQDRDSIFVPKKNEFVNVQGRVNNPGLVSYKPTYNFLDYIELAGGYGFRADEEATLVVKSKGEQFLAKNFDYKIEPGDNILVPPKEELTFWEIFTTGLTIITQLLTITGVILTIVRLR